MAEIDEILEQHPNGKYVNQEVVFRCYAKINQWLDVSLLSGYLMKYGVIKNSEDMELITSPYYTPQDRMTSLMKVLERSGEKGFLAFYAGLNETAESSMGHADAVKEINCHIDQKTLSSLSPNCYDKTDSLPTVDEDPSDSSQEFKKADVKDGVAVEADYQIACLEDQFCSISSSLYEELLEQNISTKDVLKCLVALPFGLKRELADLIQKHISELRKTEDVDELHVMLDSKFWNFIDYHLLQHIINKLGSITLRSKMAAYVKELNEFMSSTTVTNLIQFWPGRQDCPLQCSKMSIRIELNPNECTLEQLNTIRKRFCDYFLPPLSEFAMLYYKFRQGSIVVILLLASHLIPCLVHKLCSPDCYKFFDKLEISTLLIKGILVYPLSMNNKPVENKCQTDTYYSVSKVAQEHYCILSDSSISQDTAPVAQQLHHLVDEFSAFLQSNRVTAGHIVDSYPMLPIRMKTNYTSFLETLSTLKPYPLFSTQYDYIRVFGLLKIAIDKFADDPLKRDLDQYTSKLQQLRDKALLHQVLPTWENGEFNELPLSYTLLSTKLHKDPTCFTLADIEKFRSDFISQFSGSFSGSTTLILHRITSGSTVISWGLLRSDAIKLNKELSMDSNRECLEKNGVDHVALHNQTFDKTTPPAVLNFVQTYDVTRIANATNLTPHISENGRIILPYRSSSSSQLTRCRIGTLPPDSSKIDWKDRELSFQSHKFSKLYMNDKGAIMEIFESRYLRKCYYRLGHFNKDDNAIDWKSDPSPITSGTNPSASLNNSGTVLVTVESGVIRKNTHYSIGNIDEGSGNISWNADFVKFRSNCCDVSSDLNDNRTVVLSARTYHDSFILFIGQIDSGGRLTIQTVMDDPSSKFGPCVDASVSLNRAGHLVWLKVQQKRVLIITGRVIRPHNEEDSTPTGCKLKFNMATSVEQPLQHLSTSISHSGHVGFSYQSPKKSNTAVFYAVGTLFPENAVERLIRSPCVALFPLIN